MATDNDIICVTTDDDTIAIVVEDYGIVVSFKRPAHRATDEAGSYNVLLHAWQYYENQGKMTDRVIVLQPISPFRKAFHFNEVIYAFSDVIDMMVSVKGTKANPITYYLRRMKMDS